MSSYFEHRIHLYTNLIPVIKKYKASTTVIDTTGFEMKRNI